MKQGSTALSSSESDCEAKENDQAKNHMKLPGASDVKGKQKQTKKDTEGASKKKVRASNELEESKANFAAIDFEANFNASGGFDSKDAKIKVHIRAQQRMGRKHWTTVAGLPEEVRLPKTGKVYPVDFEKVLKALKKTLQTNGALKTDKEYGRIMQLQGDIRKEVADFLVRVTALITHDQLVIHGA